MEARPTSAAPRPAAPRRRPPAVARTPGKKALRILGWLAVIGLALTALGGYHLFSQMQGQPFEDIPETEFIEAVAQVIRP